MKSVQIYTDGACSINPGPGGYAAILIYKGREKTVSGFEKQTTNNRMELKAAIEGLKALKHKCKVQLFSDSAYMINSVNEGYVKKANADLWEQLDLLIKKHSVEFVKVLGHSGDVYNERCDKIAKAEIKKLIMNN